MIPYLVIDERSVERHDPAISFHLNSATKHPHNPVLTPGRPEDWDGLQVSWPGTVLYDPIDGLFRCWYAGMDVVQRPGRSWRYGYAESADGIHWVKPLTTQVLQQGRPTNRVDSEQVAFLSTVVDDRAATSPERRFVGLWIEMTDRANGRWQKRIGYSADGIHWDWTAGPIAWRDELYDISQLLVDEDAADPAARIKAYGQARFWAEGDGVVRPPDWDVTKAFRTPVVQEGGALRPPMIRAIGYLHGADFASLQEPADPLALAPEPAIDDELHFAGVQRFGSTYVMLFESDRFLVDPLQGDLRLAVSPDGHHFRRVHPTSTVVSTGPRGTWDENLLVTSTAGMVEVGDEIRIYYFGCPNVYRAWPGSYALSPDLRGSLFYPAYLGLATLPRDRFAFASGPGQLTTLPIEIGDEGVWVNVDGDGFDVTIAGAGPNGGDLHGTVGYERTRTVYRLVRWDGDEPRPGSASLRIGIPADGRLYSVLS